MLLLAIAAVLLTAAAPTVSRVLSAAMRAAPVLMEICSSGGLKLVDVSPFLGETGEPAAPAAAMDAHCGYCVLGTPLPVVLALLAGLLPWPAAAPAGTRYARAWQSLRNTRGLGSQAPPFAL
jgi:hypothetical protein